MSWCRRYLFDFTSVHLLHEGVYKNIQSKYTLPSWNTAFIFPTNFQIVGDTSKITALAKFLTVCLDYRLLVF